MTRPTMDTDPAGAVATVAAFVGAVLALLVAFGIDLTETQIEAILAVVATGGPIAVALWIRRRAWAPASHDREVEASYRRGQESAAAELDRHRWTHPETPRTTQEPPR